MRKEVEISRKALPSPTGVVHYLVLSQRELVFRNHQLLIREKKIPALLEGIKALFPDLELQFTTPEDQAAMLKSLEELEKGEED